MVSFMNSNNSQHIEIIAIIAKKLPFVLHIRLNVSFISTFFIWATYHSIVSTGTGFSFTLISATLLFLIVIILSAIGVIA